MSVSSVRLPVLATVKAAYHDVFADFPATVRALSLMLLLLIVFTELPMLFLAGYVDKNVLPEFEKQRTQISSGIMSSAASDGVTNTRYVVMGAAVGIYTLQMLFLFRFMQGWYRQWLVGEEKGKVIGMRLGRGEWQLLIASVKGGFVFLPFTFAGLMVMTAAYPNGEFTAPPHINFWPYLGALLVGALYIQARTALVYPITAMANDATACVRQSWLLTRRQGLRIALGNLLVEAPLLALAYGVFWVVSFIVSLFLPETVLIKNGGQLDLGLQLLFKVLAEFCILVFMAGLSAYHARCYAYLVRSSSSSTLH